jgi:hypothetical protein
VASHVQTRGSLLYFGSTWIRGVKSWHPGFRGSILGDIMEQSTYPKEV